MPIFIHRCDQSREWWFECVQCGLLFASGAQNFRLKDLHFLPYLAYSKTLFISEQIVYKCCMPIFIHRCDQSREWWFECVQCGLLFASGAQNFRLKDLHFLPYLAYSKTLFISEQIVYKCCMLIFIHRCIQSREWWFECVQCGLLFASGAQNFRLKDLHFLPYLAYSKTLFISEQIVYKCCMLIFIHRCIQSREWWFECVQCGLLFASGAQNFRLKDLHFLPYLAYSKTVYFTANCIQMLHAHLHSQVHPIQGMMVRVCSVWPTLRLWCTKFQIEGTSLFAIPSL